jgi:chromate reductase, NAD(P)H dehydrogenase (quinone)
MTAKPKILCFAGSLRKDSFNKKLAGAAAAIAEKAGAQTTYLDLKDYQLAVYDGDVEEESGLPDNAKKLKNILKEHDAFLIASPEYNSSISGALKNVIDWASRPEPNEKPLACFTGKVAGLVAASPGALGGLRGLVTVRSILGNIGVIVVPEQHAIAQANEAFDQDGRLKDPKHQQSLEKVVSSVIKLAAVVISA